MRVPPLETARAILEESNRLHPGPWYNHSLCVADVARRVASCCPGLNPDVACAMGMLHDVGRRYGVTALRHVVDGHDLLRGMEYDDAARICLTHSFPLQDLRAFAGNWDCTAEQLSFLTEYLCKVEYDDYDRLLQICDALALPDGPCLLERRLVDVVMRHGFNALTIQKWQATYAIKAHFETIIGGSIYDCVPEALAALR